MKSCRKPVSELFYEWYMEENTIDSEEIREDFRKINQIVSSLSVQENDQIFMLVCSLCSRHERQAFLEGLRVGVQLMRELIL